MEETKTMETPVASDSETVPSGSSMLTMKSGHTTFLIGIHFSETSKQTLDDKVRKMIRKDVEDGNF